MAEAVLTLSDFLLARIAEDAAAAPRYHDGMCEWAMRGDRGALESDCDCGLAARRSFHLAECEAKRRIVGLHEDYHVCVSSYEPVGGETSDGPCLTLRIFDAVYADHPDYRDEWKP